ncbi:hypothetical protein ACFPVX_20540 [Cohnella faecalis]|uniref:Uncharacterized protein n=1 Tax=Cohnella faecalis TaxID=2315694 RepID=A0A398CP75_9BACL|nr:hypothetical protein [Cohnella faecalis]RIE04182.1 hypothetical protein D3H35_06060 [Cohnella faecalis]
MDMQPMHATFENQDDAEEAVRKLSALRGDRFRLEKVAGKPAGVDSDASIEAAGSLGDPDSAFSSNETGGVPAFTLSANIPAEALERARTVIEQAGGSFSE